jgi:hypothetical protein
MSFNPCDLAGLLREAEEEKLAEERARVRRGGV